MKHTSKRHPLHYIACGSLIAINLASAQSWDGSTSGAWLTGTNWTGDTAAGSTSSSDTDIAVFNVNANNTIGINMNTTSGVYYLGAIDNTNATARIINNSSTTVPGILTLNGATVNSVANTILRNSTSTLLTITNGSGAGTLGLALGNATTNVIQLTGSGGITINSIISGSGGITTRGGGSGILTLSGNNSYAGVTAISNSTVTVTNANGLGSNTAGNHTTIAYTGGLNGSGGRLFLSGGITVAENITITGDNNTGNAGYNVAIGSSSGTNTFGGTITLTGSTAGSTIRIGQNTTIFSGTITQSGLSANLGLQGTTTVNNPITINGGAVTVIGSASVVTLGGVSGSGIGNTGVAQSGTLVLGVTDALNTTSNLTVGAFGATDTGTVSLNGFNQTVNALNSNSPTVQTGSRIVRNNHATIASTLTVGNGGSDGTFNGTIVNGGAATLAITKVGSGTQTLSGANTYTGATSINEGTLALGATGSIATSPTITVASGATFNVSGVTGGWSLGSSQTLAGAGSVSGNVTTAGKIAPGTSGIGTLSVTGNTTFNSGTNFDFQLAPTGTTSDRLTINGTLTKGTGTTYSFNFMGSTPDYNTVHTLLTFTSSSGLSTSNFSATNLGSGPYGTSFFTLTPTSLTWTAVPEASNLLIGGLLGLGLMSRRRKNA